MLKQHENACVLAKENNCIKQMCKLEYATHIDDSPDKPLDPYICHALPMMALSHRKCGGLIVLLCINTNAVPPPLQK